MLVFVNIIYIINMHTSPMDVNVFCVYLHTSVLNEMKDKVRELDK